MRRLRRMQPRHALHSDAARAVAFDLRAHLDEQLGEIRDLRLLRGVLQHRFAVGQRGGHQQVLGAGHRDHVGRDPRSLQPRGLGDDVAVLDGDVGTHREQALDVLVHRARADRAAAGQRHARLAEARQQRAQHEDRRAHRLHQVVGGFGVIQRAGIDHHLVGPIGAALGGRAHAAQQLQRGGHVLQLRHVGQRHRISRQQRGAQLGQRSVLGAGNGDLALEGAAAADEEFVHGCGLFESSARQRVGGGVGVVTQTATRSVTAGGVQWWWWCSAASVEAFWASHSAGVSVFIDSA